MSDGLVGEAELFAGGAAGTFDSWRERAPEGFRYMLKYSCCGSHIKRLSDPRGHIDRFLERARRLGGLLGPVLVQLPPRWRAEAGRPGEFLEAAGGLALLRRRRK